MLNFIKQNWFKLVILIILIFAIGGAFYWFQLRPNKIIKDCYSLSFRLPVEDRDGFYQFCLKINGLKNT